MKKAFATTAGLVLALSFVHAQEPSGVRFGIRLSPNMSWLRPDTKGLKSDGTELGYTFGLMGDFPIGGNGNYAFSTGLFLQKLGGAYTQDFAYVESVSGPELTKALKTEVNLRYIELPITMKLLTNEIGYMRYFGLVGVSSAFNIRAKADFETPVVAGTLNDGTPIVTGFGLLEDEDIKDDVTMFRAGLVIGAGLKYNFSGNTALVAGVTYNSGFTNLLDGVEYQGKKAKVLTDYLELNLGFLF